MVFEMWTWYHYLYILSPFFIIAALWALLKNKSEKTKYIVGAVIGIVSLAIIVTRNIDIYVRGGFSHEIIPLQVCHFGKLLVFNALVFRSKIATSIVWTVNLVPAFISLIDAEALANYSTIWAIRPQAYIWGHLFIVIGALYPIILKTIKFGKKDFYKGLLVILGLFATAFVANPLLRNVFGYNANYFYVYNSSGVPFSSIYNLGSMVSLGWFEFNPIYVGFLILLGVSVIFGMYALSRLITRPSKKLDN